jgi:anti-sigma-K factor RskA
LWQRIEALVAGQALPRAGSVVPLSAARLKRSVAIWRSTAVAATAVAAASLVWIVAGGILNPPANPGGRYVAVVDANGTEPALIAEVDTGRGTIRVRSLQTETPAGRSLELWHIPDGQAPHSLGVLKVGATAQSIREAIPPESVAGKIAVTVEPEGGSPSGAPTGPVVYSGQLLPMDD